MKKVAILGKLETKYNAPFKDLGYDIWTMNLHKDHNRIPRITTCFDLHKVPQNPNADILKKDFPFQACRELVGGNYFNNTVSYLIALALLQGYEEILLYGMRFTCDHERRHGEYQNVQNLICFARGKGVKVLAPSDVIMLCGLESYLTYKGVVGTEEINLCGIRGKQGIKTINIVKDTIQYIQNGYGIINLLDMDKDYSNLIFYGKGVGVTINNLNKPIKEFPSYENVNGKDFDWF